ncbi:hypothetical protein DFJ74DRAFT_612875 [Hyaloraphidium curvatum]|nr:hypothetical protein DFJ74DRAFT_612875 [Hyaloraphidium curvatum]
MDLVKAAALLGSSAVILGAFGAHGLRTRFASLPDGGLAKLKSWETAAHYQLMHSVAVLALGLRQRDRSKTFPSNMATAGNLWLVGAAMFSGSIYALVLNPHWRILGPVTPLGGMAMIAGWAVLAFGSE